MSNLDGQRLRGTIKYTLAGNRGHRPCSGDRWAVILAGGDGTRLRSLTRVLAGDDRPKQFCKVIGDETLLEQTRRRVVRAVRPTQTLFVLTETHEEFYSEMRGNVAPRQLVVQPRNAGTAPAILYSLLRLARLAPDSSVAFFPSDHYISDDRAFMAHVETAFAQAHAGGGSIILLGIKPEGHEGEYGWIEPAPAGVQGKDYGLCRVRRFWEKPTPELARTLMARGCLWNSFVMVGRVSAFLEMIRRAAPELFDHFGGVSPHLHTTLEGDVIRELYSGLGESNFSQEVLAARPADLSVLPVSGLKWSDLGRPERVLSTIAGLGQSIRAARGNT